MDQLLENRMKELSGNDMEVWVFDTKRNPQVLKGRLEQEQAARRKEESMMDLELDFLAPYLERMLKFFHYFYQILEEHYSNNSNSDQLFPSLLSHRLYLKNLIVAICNNIILCSARSEEDKAILDYG